MKKLLLLLFVLLSSFGFAQSVVIPDPNFEQALIDLNIDNTSPTDEIDGVLGISPAVTGTRVLDISAKGITDLTGIDEFVSLEVLNCELNALTSVDLSGNLLLEDLRIWNNSLTSLDLSQNVNLTTVWCQSNEIETLNLPVSTTLNTLECQFNNLSSLDFSNSGSLTNLKIQHNTFSDVDLSNLTLLRDLDAFDNGLQSINLDNCSSLVKLNLRNNNLTSLIIEDKPALYRMLLQFNDLTELTVKNVDFDNFNLNLQGNTNLSCVEVTDPDYSNANWDWLSLVTYSADCSPSFFNIPDPNFEQALIDQNIDSDGIINGQVLQSDIVDIDFLDVSANNISDLAGIEGFLALETLFASGNNLTNLDVSQNTNLDGLYVGENNLTSIDVSANTNLRALILGSNQLTGIDVSNNVLLTQLFLQNNELTIIDVTNLEFLVELNISENNLNELDLSQNSALTTLDCSDNDLLSLNIQNANNTAIVDSSFNARFNENLNCIQVDVIAYSANNWTNIDSQSFFDVDCAPNNDDCIEATILDLGTLINGTTFGSTSSNSSPSCQEDDIVLFDVWYQFTAPDSGLVTAVATSVLNSLPINLAIYEDCNAVEPISCDSGTMSLADLIPGNTYLIQIWVGGTLQGRSSLNQIDEFTIIVEDSEALSTTEVVPAENSLRLVPNPASNQTLITSISEDISGLQVFDITGKKVLELFQINKRNQRIDTSELSKGIYLVVVELDNETRLTKKLLIK